MKYYGDREAIGNIFKVTQICNIVKYTFLIGTGQYMRGNRTCAVSGHFACRATVYILVIGTRLKLFSRFQFMQPQYGVLNENQGDLDISETPRLIIEVRIS